MTYAQVNSHLVRAELWSADIKEALQDELMAQNWVNWLTSFPDGNQFTIPSVGDATVQNIVENEDPQYEALDTGEFTFTITEYVGSAHYMTRKALQDSFYAQRILASFVPKETRAIMEKVESDVLSMAGATGAYAFGHQTAAVQNQINGADHRFVATGTNQVMTPADFAKAKYGLKKANVPQINLVAIVDPSVAYALETSANFINFSNNPKWEGIVESSLTTGMRFIKNVYGFDVWESNYLPDAGATANGSETINSVAATNAKCNVFFSAADQEILPFMGAWRQMPIVDSEFNKDKQREEYLTTGRYGMKVYRPENLMVVISDTSQV
jgi:hypothetical protein